MPDDRSIRSPRRLPVDVEASAPPPGGKTRRG
jgi:hypothetical protein